MSPGLAKCRICGDPVDVVVRTSKGSQCVQCAGALIEGEQERLRIVRRWFLIAVVLAAGMLVSHLIRG